MTVNEIEKILEEERTRKQTIASNNLLIEDLNHKMFSFSQRSKYEKVQTSFKQEPNYVALTEMVFDLERENIRLLTQGIEFEKLITSRKLDAVERDIIVGYYSRGCSYRKTALYINNIHETCYDHKRITRELKKIVEILAQD